LKQIKVYFCNVKKKNCPNRGGHLKHLKQMVLRIFQILFLFGSCTGGGQEEFTGTYYTDTKESYITVDSISDDVIYGSHCFVSVSGERIDCCVEEKSSFNVQRKDKTKYEGTLLSCYDDLEYAIMILFDEESIKLTFKEENHPFMVKEIKFFKEKE